MLKLLKDKVEKKILTSIKDRVVHGKMLKEEVPRISPITKKLIEQINLSKEILSRNVQNWIKDTKLSNQVSQQIPLK